MNTSRSFSSIGARRAPASGSPSRSSLVGTPSFPSHHRVEDHQKRLLLLRLGLVDHRDRLADPEPPVQLVGGVRGGHQDPLRGDPSDERSRRTSARPSPASRDRRSAGRSTRRSSAARRTDGCTSPPRRLAVALLEDVRPEVAERDRIVDDDDPLALDVSVSPSLRPASWGAGARPPFASARGGRAPARSARSARPARRRSSRRRGRGAVCR